MSIGGLRRVLKMQGNTYNPFDSCDSIAFTVCPYGVLGYDLGTNQLVVVIHAGFLFLFSFHPLHVSWFLYTQLHVGLCEVDS